MNERPLTLPGLREDTGFAKYYKHKTISRFTVGPFNFVNHLLTIKSEEENDDFIREVSGLLLIDQVNIVEVANIQNEKPLDLTARVNRGATGSQHVKSANLSAEGKAAELDRREQELLEREAIISHRERNIPPIPPLLVAGDLDPGANLADSTLDPNSETSQDATEQHEADSAEVPEADLEPAPALDPAPVKIGGLRLNAAQSNT